MTAPEPESLAAYFASLSESQVRVLVEVLTEGATSPLLDGLWTAVGFELVAFTEAKQAEEVWLRAQEDLVLAALEADHRAELDAVELRVHGPYPPVEGKPAWFDPETGRFCDGPPGSPS